VQGNEAYEFSRDNKQFYFIFRKEISIFNISAVPGTISDWDHAARQYTKPSSKIYYFG